jgi:hypothetical protein
MADTKGGEFVDETQNPLIRDLSRSQETKKDFLYGFLSLFLGSWFAD